MRITKYISRRNRHSFRLIEIRLKRNPLINIGPSLCVYEAIITIGTLKHLTNTLEIVKNEYIYEIASLKSSTLLDKLELLPSFFIKDLTEVYITAYSYLKFIRHRNGCFCIFTMK